MSTPSGACLRVCVCVCVCTHVHARVHIMETAIMNTTIMNTTEVSTPHPQRTHSHRIHSRARVLCPTHRTRAQAYGLSLQPLPRITTLPAPVAAKAAAVVPVGTRAVVSRTPAGASVHWFQKVEANRQAPKYAETPETAADPLIAGRQQGRDGGWVSDPEAVKEARRTTGEEAEDAEGVAREPDRGATSRPISAAQAQQLVGEVPRLAALTAGSPAFGPDPVLEAEAGTPGPALHLAFGKPSPISTAEAAQSEGVGVGGSASASSASGGNGNWFAGISAWLPHL